MPVPQVRERIKEAPAQALRGVFAGIGQLLLITDKLRNKAPADSDVPQARTPEASQTLTDAPVTSPGDQRAETQTTAPAESPPAEPTAAGSATAATAPAQAVPAGETVAAAKAAPAEPTADAPPKRQSTRDFDKTGNVRLLGDEAASSPPGATAPPLPNYDELSIASLRARLRNLDVAQVRKVAEYEQTHAARADVLTMFERRIAKLEAQA